MALPAAVETRPSHRDEASVEGGRGPVAAPEPSTGPSSSGPVQSGSSARKERRGAPFLRRDVVRSHRRPRRIWAFLRLVANALVVAGLPVAILAWGLTTPRLGVRVLVVEGSERVPADWVEEALTPWIGRNLFQVSLDGVHRRLEGHPWLEGASVRKRLPDRLEVAVTEKLPVALAEGQDRTFFVDSAGAVIAPLAETQGREVYPDLPLVRGARRAPEDVAGALEIYREFQGLELGSLSEIEVLGEDDYRLISEGWPYPLIVSAGSLREKHRHLDRLFTAIAVHDQQVEAVDLRFAQRIVLKPEGASGSSGERLPSRG